MEQSSDTHVLAMPASASILTAKDFAGDLLSACQTYQHIHLNADGITQADLSFLQIVHSARQHMAERGGSLTLTQPANAVLTKLLSAAGFSSEDSDTEFWFKEAISQ